MPTRRPRKPVFWDIDDLDNVTEYSERLEAAAANGLKDDDLLLEALLTALLGKSSLHVLRYLIEQEHAPVKTILPERLVVSQSTEVFQLFLDNGWDINSRKIWPIDEQPDKTLLQLVCFDDSLVEWCLEHGAKVEDYRPHALTNPPLFDLASQYGSLRILKLLYAKGAKPGPRAVHFAALRAAHYNNDQDLNAAIERLQYLLDDLHLDINALDTTEKWPSHYGTPLHYALRALESESSVKLADVVRFLLDRGADPTIKDCYGQYDACELAHATEDFRHYRSPDLAKVKDMLVEAKKKWLEQHPE